MHCLLPPPAATIRPYRVTELPLALEPLTRDPFADGLDTASRPRR